MLDVADMSLWYGESKIIENLSLEIPPESCYGLLGPSGCGKTTFLRAVLSAAQRRADSRRRTDFRYEGRISCRCNGRVGYVPQEPSLAPWLTVKGNILLGIRLSRLPHGSKDAGVLDMVSDCLKLTECHALYPDQLSTGTAKRVSLARALVTNPKLYLLDEPFAGYDYDLREEAMELLRKTLLQQSATLIIVTHDPYEVARLCSEAHIFSSTPMRYCKSVARSMLDIMDYTAKIFEELGIRLGGGS